MRLCETKLYHRAPGCIVPKDLHRSDGIHKDHMERKLVWKCGCEAIQREYDSSVLMVIGTIFALMFWGFMVWFFPKAKVEWVTD